MVNVWIGSFYSLRIVLFLWIFKHVIVECENVTESSPPGAGDEHQQDEEVIKETVSENPLLYLKKKLFNLGLVNLVLFYMHSIQI